MNRKVANRTLRVGFGIAVATLIVAGRAEARPEVLRFSHAEPGRVASYRVIVGSAAGRNDLLDQTLSNISAPDASGVRTVMIDVASPATVYIRLSAIGTDGSQSAPSNEIQRSVPLGLPGQPMVVLP